MEAGAAGIDTLANNLAGPKSRLKTRLAVEQAATAAQPGGLARSTKGTRGVCPRAGAQVHHPVYYCTIWP
jgi:hypothetical protein